MKKVISISTIIATSVLSALLAVVIYAHITGRQEAKENTTSTTPSLVPHYASMVTTQAINTDFTTAAEKSVHAVVHIMTTGTSDEDDYPSNPLLEYFYGYKQQAPQPVKGSGSGVLINADGYIVTNNHVIKNSSDIQVTLNDKRTFKAKLVGTDPTTDVAVIKIECKDKLPFLEYGNSDALKVGQWVLAVGNPFNLTSTVTAGVVSAKARSINIIANQNNTMGIESFIQTDAAVNPGNSGGALVNTDGELVGINTAIASPTGVYSGYSFAVPVSIVKKVVADIVEYGEVQRALLGVSIRDIDNDLSKNENLGVLEGAYVAGVAEHSAAMEAGLKEKDVITAINGQQVNSVSQLQEQISRYRPGDKVTVSILRNGTKKDFTVNLKNEQGTTEVVKSQDASTLGGNFAVISESTKRQMGISYGVQVVKVSTGKLKEANIRAGFIIVDINGAAIKAPSDISDQVKNSDGGLFITGIYPNGKTAYYAINLAN